LEDTGYLKEDFEKCFEGMQNLVNKSFDLMHRDAMHREEIINLWKMYIPKFTSYTFKTGEKYDNKEIFKAITKAMIFGK
jgi:hypothetical protein